MVRKRFVSCVLGLLFLVGGLVTPFEGIAGSVPSPPCSGCGGKPSVPKPLAVLQPSPLLSTPIPNAVEYDGSNFWLTDSASVRRELSIPVSGITPLQMQNPWNWGSTQVITEPDGSSWSSTGLIYGSGTSLSFPDGSAWSSSGLTFGTGGTEKMPDGSTWNSTGLISNGVITANKDIIHPVTFVSTSQSLLNTGGYVFVTVGGLTLSLPTPASSKGKEITFVNQTGGGFANSTTISGTFINSLSHITLPNNWNSIKIFSDGTNWNFNQYKTVINTYITSNFTTTANQGWVVVPLADKSVDLLNEFNTTNYQFIPLFDGYYEISFVCLLPSSVATNVEISFGFFQSGGSTPLTFTGSYFSATSNTATISTAPQILALNAGSIYYLEVNTGNAGFTFTASNISMVIKRVF